MPGQADESPPAEKTRPLDPALDRSDSGRFSACARRSHSRLRMVPWGGTLHTLHPPQLRAVNREAIAKPQGYLSPHIRLHCLTVCCSRARGTFDGSYARSTRILQRAKRQKSIDMDQATTFSEFVICVTYFRLLLRHS